MTNTTYYNLNIVEGTDIVNPLIVDNPNYEKIDEVMHDNAVSGVTLATEIANATVHAITRENSECAVIRFIATSNWKAGDTITVDGVPVSALLPSGETLPDGAYVINANVLCILTGTNLTVYAERKKIDNANEIRYNDTNVGAELNKINSNFVHEYVNTDIDTLSIIKTGERFVHSGITYFNTIIKGNKGFSSYLTTSNSDLYLGYAVNSFPPTNSMPIIFKGMLITQDMSVTQECVLYIKNNGGIYLSIPQTLKSPNFNYVLISDTYLGYYDR